MHQSAPVQSDSPAAAPGPSRDPDVLCGGSQASPQAEVRAAAPTPTSPSAPTGTSDAPSRSRFRAAVSRRVSFRTASLRAEWGIDLEQANPAADKGLDEHEDASSGQPHACA